MINVDIGDAVCLQLQDAMEVIKYFLDGRDDAYAYSKAALLAFDQNVRMLNQLKDEHPELTSNKEFNQMRSATDDVLPDYSMIAQVLMDNPILIVDPVIDNLVNDTSPAIEKFKIPYPGFFINKKFEIEAGFVAGVFIYDPLEITIQICKKNGRHAWRRELMQARENRLTNCININNDMLIAFVVFRNGNFTINHASINGILCPQNCNSTLTDSLGGISPASKLTDEMVAAEMKLLFEIEKKVFHYAVNVANLLNLHADPGNPRNPKRDLQIIPTNLKNAQGVKFKKVKNIYKIHVGGKIRQYAEGYNEALRRNGCLHAVQVRGHFRTFHSERYKKMQGKTIWILPFIRGADRELRQQIIKIIE